MALNPRQWFLVKTGITLGALLIVSLVGFGIWYANWVNFVENYQLGYTFDKTTGKVEIVKKQGWIIRTPWLVDVHHIDLRPGQVCMNANARVLNCKLVQFNPDGLDTFVKWHGRAAGEGQNIYEILKSYAFNVNEGRDCPFLLIIDDMQRKNTTFNVQTNLPARGSPR
jgi:hypothetical protein